MERLDDLFNKYKAEGRDLSPDCLWFCVQKVLPGQAVHFWSWE